MQATATFDRGRAMAPEPRHNTSLRLIGHHDGHDGSDSAPDHFIERDGKVFAGTHLIIDLWGAKHIDELDRMEQVLRDAAEVAGATLLHIHLHHFTPNGGISGVAVLAESHISVHTWPERDFAAFDVFMCGDAEPTKAIAVLSTAFHPTRMIIGEHQRGVVGGHG